MPDFRNFNQDTYLEQTRIQRLKLKRTRKGRIFLTAFCSLIIVGAIFYAAFVYADNLWVLVANRYFNNRINALGATEPALGKAHRLNVMLIGVDRRKQETARSDTLMVAMLNLKEKSIQVISIPRDSRVKIEGLAHRTKINHAHATGGIELTRKTVEQMLGIPVHQYVETNFQGFENIIDIIGGVTLDVEKRMYYPAEGIDLQRGPQRLNGYDALGYVRYRSDGKGDLPRIERQHKFLAAFAAETLQPKTILKLPNIAGELHSNINTDMSVKDLLVLGSEFKNIGSQKIHFYNVPGAPLYINGASYFVVDEEKLRLLIDEILNGENPSTVTTGNEEGIVQEGNIQ